jgi:hypothetical protein
MDELKHKRFVFFGERRESFRDEQKIHQHSAERPDVTVTVSYADVGWR